MITIARLTIREMLNKKVLYIVLALTLAFLAVYAVSLRYTVQQITGFAGSKAGSVQMLTVYPELLSMGLYFSTFIVALLAVFSTVGCISGEIETGTIQAILPKPMKRADYVLGKYVGYAFITVTYAAGLYLVLIGVVKYYTGYSPSAIGEGLAHFLVIPLVLEAITICGSSLFSTMANGMTMVMLYMLGTVGGMVEQIGHMMKSTALVNIGIMSSLIVPSDAIYRKMVFQLLTGTNNPINTFTFNPFATARPPSSAMVVYSVIYLLIFLLITVKVFNKKDI